MPNKGINYITLPVYKEVVKQVPAIVKKAMEEGIIPEGLRVITIDSSDYETPLQEILTTEEMEDLLNGKACLRFNEGGDSANEYIIYYPQLGLNGVHLVRFDLFNLVMYIYNYNDGSESCFNINENEEEVAIPTETGTKLYKHVLKGFGGMMPQVEIISTSSTKFTEDGVSKSLASVVLSNITNILKMYEYSGQRDLHFYLDGGTGPQVFAITFNGTSIGASSVSINFDTDTVTPL